MAQTHLRLVDGTFMDKSYVDVYGPRPIATALTNSGSVTTADVYPAS